MTDAASIPACMTQIDVDYLPKPNRVELVLTDVAPPAHLSPTSFMIGITSDNGLVLADHAERGLEITGGHVEPGENAVMAAIREGGEESGAEYGTVWQIGYLRCVSDGTVPDDHRYPHPVSYQVLHAAVVTSMTARDDYLECRRPVMLSPDGIAAVKGYFGQQLAQLHAAALRALGRDRPIDELAQDAKPIDEDDWASNRQIDAQNRFFDECERLRPDLFGDDSDFADWCLKATTDEMIEEATRLLVA